MGCSKRPAPMTVESAELSGYVIEDVWIDKKERYDKWEPHIQAIKHNNGDLSLRFCYWTRRPDGSRGDFVHAPMFVYDWTIEDLREEAKKYKADVVLMLLKKFIE